MASSYPDGSTNPAWNPHLRVIVPLRESHTFSAQVPVKQIRAVVCHRTNIDGHEQYLLEWESTTRITPYSWHGLNELDDCLALVQEYIEGLGKFKRSTTRDTLPLPSLPHLSSRGTKRKSPDSDETSLSRASIGRSSPALSVTSSSASDLTTCVAEDEPEVYNGTLLHNDGEYAMHKPTKLSVLRLDLPSPQMRARALRTDFRQALHRIAAEFDARLTRTFAAPATVRLAPPSDGTRPPLTFTFIRKSVLGDGVYAADPATIIGCGQTRSKGHTLRCSPNMGQSIGCEYGRLCECLEYAAVDEARLTEDDKLLYDSGELAGLPKRFPYHNPNVPGRGGCLVPFYIKSRHPIYECNRNCNCGHACKSRVVQFGRKVPLEIFKTANRGWGLRCTIDLKEGQFIDTYRGEIITNEEADRREEGAPKGKASYLYSLDKHVDDGETGLTAADCYIIDGETMGGPTRFINHSCEPSCRQYTVSTNKFDTRIYDIAFFACKPIKAYTELTFDYVDKDEEDETEDELTHQNEDMDKSTAIPCHCGAKKCRGTLWI